jgi:hypothetical protein
MSTIFLQVISEESDIRPVSFRLIDNVNSYNEEVEKLVKSDMSVPFHSVSVWVDPLDATQEYKGKCILYYELNPCYMCYSFQFQTLYNIQNQFIL